MGFESTIHGLADPGGPREQLRAMARYLAEARNPDGSRRFYPPGEHPAGDRYRAELEHVEAFRCRVPDTPELLAYIAYLERQIAAIEAGEERAKRAYLRAFEARIESTGPGKASDGAGRVPRA